MNDDLSNTIRAMGEQRPGALRPVRGEVSGYTTGGRKKRAFALGGLPGSDNDLTRANQMGAAADRMRKERTAAPVVSPVASGLQSTRVGAVTQNNLQQDPINTLTNQVDMGRAVENSNLTMTEKAALGMGTSSAAASEMRKKTDALASLRDGIAAQQQPNTDSAWIGGGNGDPLNSTWKPAFAGGGLVDVLRNRTKMIDAIVDQASGEQQAGAPEPSKPSQGSEADTYAAESARIEAEQQAAAKARMKTLEKKRGFLGFRRGGKISGPGTATSDSIPAKVSETGEDILVSNGERIVSVDQETALRRIAEMLGYGSVDAMFEALTKKTVGPTVKAKKRAAANGLPPEEAHPIDIPANRAGAPSPLVSGYRPSRSNDPYAMAANAQRPATLSQENPQPAAQSVTKPIEQGLQERTFQKVPPAAGPVSATVEKPPSPIVSGIISGRGKTTSIQQTPTAAEGYVDAQGNPVTDWKQTKRYSEAMDVNNRMSKLAEQMKRDRLERDMGADITSPLVRDAAERGLAQMDRRATHQAEAQSRLLESQIKQTKLAGDTRLGALQTAYIAETDPTRQEALAAQIRGITGRGAPSGQLTAEQSRSNIEIDAARKSIAGLSPEEIRKKTAKQTNTGRENPDFDPTLERAVTLANRRKVGADDHFDQRLSGPASQPTDDLAKRFQTDPAMRGHRLGKQTDKGIEVLDSNGRLIGHYR